MTMVNSGLRGLINQLQTYCHIIEFGANMYCIFASLAAGIEFKLSITTIS